MDIRELRNAGLKKTAVAKRVGLHRETVAKYWDGPIDNVEPPRYKQRQSVLDPYKEYITEQLERYPELEAQSLFHKIRKQGYTGSPRTVRRFVAQIRPRAFREYKPVEVLPGEQAQVDWGHLGSTVVDGTRRQLYVFVMTLSWSRAMYIEFITSLNIAAFAGSLHRALASFNGVPEYVVFDNAKTVVADRVGHVVQFNPDLLQMALRYGFTPKACWVNDPESKGRVESCVKYVKRGFFYGREYADLEDLNRQAREWIETVAHRRVHGTTFKLPGEELLEERECLRPFVAGDGPAGVLEQRSVRKDALITVDQNFYSVPSHLSRRRINIRRFENRFEVLDGDQIVAKHTLMDGKGNRRILNEHYPHANRQRRSQGLQLRFEELCPEAAGYLQGLSRSGTGSLREQMESIVSLNHDYTPAQFSAAMQRALTYGSFGYGSLKRILQIQAKAPESLPQVPAASTPATIERGAGALQRDPSYYAGVGT